MTQGYVVVLTQDEVERCAIAAKLRTLYNVRGPGSTRPVHPDAEFIGIIGEYAFACDYGVAEQLLSEGRDGGKDFSIDGTVFQVKTNSERHQGTWVVGHPLKADWCIFVDYNGKDSALHIVGCMSREQLHNTPTTQGEHRPYADELEDIWPGRFAGAPKPLGWGEDPDEEA